MKNTKTNKMLISVLCFAMVMTLSVSVFAKEIGGVNINPTTGTNATNTATEFGNEILGILQTVGILLSVGVLMVLGIKYMMGSAEEKAEYKKTFIPFIIGAVLVFAASALAGVLFDWANNFGNKV